LPFRDATFDLAFLYEAIYYLLEPTRFLVECRRILRPQGRLLLCSVNCHWPAFNPSPYSRRYYSAAELEQMVRESGFDPVVYAAYSDTPYSFQNRAVSFLRGVTARLHLIPKTMKAKEKFKRIFYGTLTAMPAELGDSEAPIEMPIRMNAASIAGTYKVVYVEGTRR